MSDETMVIEGALADRSTWRPDECPVGSALDVVGTRSAMLIMREAYYGTTRFDDFARRVGVTEAIAAARLRDLTAAGLFERHPYQDPGQRTRHEYRLTEMGRELAPVVIALNRWGSKYLTDAGGPVELSHRGCGAPIQVEVRCAEEHAVELGEISVTARNA
jgi:DNA-binding HxlR family transcriptional regulator